MKKIYNIPVHNDAERLGAYLEGNLSEAERRQMKLDIQNDPELAELAKDDIIIDWDADISEDYPEFDWKKDGDLIELNEQINREFDEMYAPKDEQDVGVDNETEEDSPSGDSQDESYIDSAESSIEDFEAEFGDDFF